MDSSTNTEDWQVETRIAGELSGCRSYVQLLAHDQETGLCDSRGCAITSTQSGQCLHCVPIEAKRILIDVSHQCEENNSVTRDLTLLQAFLLSLDVGLWSGNKRRTELAESQALVIVTVCH